jgi:hypothetical protein
VFNDGAIPLGALTAGAIASHAGVRSTLWIMLGGLVLSPCLLLFGPLRHMRDIPPNDDTSSGLAAAVSAAADRTR